MAIKPHGNGPILGLTSESYLKLSVTSSWTYTWLSNVAKSCPDSRHVSLFLFLPVSSASCSWPASEASIPVLSPRSLRGKTTEAFCGTFFRRYVMLEAFLRLCGLGWVQPLHFRGLRGISSPGDVLIDVDVFSSNSIFGAVTMRTSSKSRQNLLTAFCHYF